MSKKHVKVNIFAIKDELGNEGMVQIKVSIPPWNRKTKARRDSFHDGVASGVAAMMQHFQPSKPTKVD